MAIKQGGALCAHSEGGGGLRTKFEALPTASRLLRRVGRGSSAVLGRVRKEMWPQIWTPEVTLRRVEWVAFSRVLAVECISQGPDCRARAQRSSPF